ncbi:unnamed protein product [Lota lota]
MLGGWCVLVCVVLWGCWECETAECECNTCVDLDILDTLLDMNTTRTTDLDSRILLAHSSFDRIRGNPKLHACVLMEVLKFYQSLLRRTSENVNLLYFLKSMERCVRQNHTFCSVLKREASSHLSIKGSRGVALLQISKLDQASHKLDDKVLQEKAMVELQMLKDYVRGSGFRHYQLIKKP